MLSLGHNILRKFYVGTDLVAFLSDEYILSFLALT